MESPALLITSEATPFVCYSFQTICQQLTITVKRDIDNDGDLEQFVIRPEQQGIEVVLVKGKYGYCNSIYWEGGNETEKFVQINYIDLDKDGKEELILSYDEENCFEKRVIIFKVRDAEEDSFKEIGSFDFQDVVYFEDNHFECPYGSQGLFEEYLYDKGRVFHVEE